MSGHSKWATIKHKKGATDAKRGAAFTKIIKEMTVAARIGGGDPGMNPRLRTVVEKAKAVNMPADNIKRAIQKGTGELPGQVIEEVTFEGYGPGGVAVIVETATDNRNRTVGDVRHTFDKYGGNLGQNGCVAWMFDKKGVIEVDAAKANEDELMELVLEAGADDMKLADGTFEITTSVASFETVRLALEAKGVADVARRTDHDPPDLGAPGRQTGHPDAQAHGRSRGPRGRAEGFGELRHRRQRDGAVVLASSACDPGRSA